MAWEGETVALLGGGPSLSLEQVEMVRAARVRCIAVNDAYLLAPFADVCYFADVAWWEWHTKGIDKPQLKLTAAQVRERFASFAGLKCSIQNQNGQVPDDAVHVLLNYHFPRKDYGLSLEPGKLVTGRNGGFQALNLAILAGAKTAILLGYDGQDSRDGKTHFHGGHPKITPQEWFAYYRQSFTHAEPLIKAAGVRVLNASPGSAITFERMDLAEALRLQPDPQPAGLQAASV